MKKNQHKTQSKKPLSTSNDDDNINSFSGSRLVFSTDPKDLLKMSGFSEKQKLATEQENIIANTKFVAVFRLESNGRGGKTVPVIDKLPVQESFLKDLTKELKSKCGVGGTHLIANGFGVVEIQGDKRDAIKKIFDIKGIKYKGM